MCRVVTIAAGYRGIQIPSLLKRSHLLGFCFTDCQHLRTDYKGQFYLITFILFAAATATATAAASAFATGAAADTSSKLYSLAFTIPIAIFHDIVTVLLVMGPLESCEEGVGIFHCAQPLKPHRR
jgi:hypothetical protein